MGRITSFGAFTTLVISSLLLTSGFSSAAESRVSGLVDFRAGAGEFSTEKAELVIPEKWQGQLELASATRSITSSGFKITRAGDKTFLTAAFSDLPNDKTNSVLILSGEYSKSGYSGQAFVRTFDDAKQKETSLTDFIDAKSGYSLCGSFRFGKSNVRPTRNQDHVNPDGSFWSTGGVGRNREYYTGREIQNPGRPSQAAGFERGLPYALTRQGQLDAQRVGIERSWLLQRQMYSNRGWGWGWFFW